VLADIHARVQLWASAGGGTGFAPWKLGLSTILENLKLAAKFRLIDLIDAITAYLPVWHCTRARFAVLVSCNDEFAVRSCPLLRLQRQVAKLASGLFNYWSLLRKNNTTNKSSNVH